MSFKLRRLRTTPARKPRTECCCQPVAFAIAAIVAPVGDCSIASIRDCFELRLGRLVSGAGAICCCGFFAPALDLVIDRLFVDFDIEILPFGSGRARAAPPKPHYSDEAGGAGSQSAFQALGIGASTAPIILESQSFLSAIPTKRATLNRANSRERKAGNTPLRRRRLDRDARNVGWSDPSSTENSTGIISFVVNPALQVFLDQDKLLITITLQNLESPY